MGKARLNVCGSIDARQSTLAKKHDERESIGKINEVFYLDRSRNDGKKV
jgi:hypothetical protein